MKWKIFLLRGRIPTKAADTGSKILLNRALEENTVPTIWLANDIGKFHGSVKQRFKFPLCVGYPANSDFQGYLGTSY